MQREIKIYAMNECDWMAAASPLEAAIGYAETMYQSLDSMIRDEQIDIQNGCPIELTKRDMRRLKFHDDDDGNPRRFVRSFRKQLDNMIAAGQKFPCFFASTEC